MLRGKLLPRLEDIAVISLHDYKSVMANYGTDPIVFLSLGADSVSDGALFVIGTEEAEKYVCFIRQNKQDFISFEEYDKIFSSTKEGRKT